MTTATNTSVNEELYDPENPPEDRGFLGRFTITAHVADGKVSPSWGPENDARILDIVKGYVTNPKVNYDGPVWFIEGEGIDVARTDGQPFRQHDIIKLKTSNGRDLNKKQTPDQFAQAYIDAGLTANYHRIDQGNTAVGRVIQFASHEFSLGGGYKKSVALFPKEVMDADFVYTGEVRQVTPRAQRGEEQDAGAPVSGVTNTMEEAEVVALLVSTLEGKRPDQMMDAILEGDPRLKNVDTVFGVALLDAATDESLSAILIENKAMTLSANGKLQAS